MTLARKMVWKIVALIASLGFLGGASLWGLTGLQQEIHLARDEYKELRTIQDVGIRAAAAKGLFAARDPDHRAAIEELHLAVRSLETFLSYQNAQVEADPGHQTRESSAARTARAALLTALAVLNQAPDDVPDNERSTAVISSLEDAMTHLNRLAGEMDAIVATTHVNTSIRLRAAIVVLGLLSGVVIAVAVLLNVSQYRTVMVPLRRLREGVRSVASGNFARALAPVREPEFQELTDDFNRMAIELRDLYRNLEEKVRSRTRELVRSERLASAGFLAAGVAHEINNPLSIISGHAELSLKQLRHNADPAAVADAAHALQIIRDEAFRCKEITEKLLSLTRAGPDTRTTVSVVRFANEVSALISGIRKYRTRHLNLQFDPADDLLVTGNETELKQVLLNLTINALEAVEPHGGQVRIEGTRRNGWVEFAVADNGCGMTPQTLERVFEPFFTHRRGASSPGTGLGLSITHAIVEAHGGRIHAESDGPRKGSRFVVRLPSADSGNNHADNAA